MKDRSRQLLPYVFPAAAAISFVVALALAAIDRAAGAGVAVMLFALCYIFHNFPRIESLKAFSIEAKLNKQIDRAEELLGKIRQAALVSARMQYDYLVSAGRFSSPSWRQKREMSAELDKLLTELQVSAEELSGLKRTYLDSLVNDLYGIFVNAYDERMIHYLSEKHTKKYTGVPGETHEQMVARHQLMDREVEVWEEARRKRWTADVRADTAGYISQAAEDVLTPPLLPQKEVDALRSLAARIQNIAIACVQKGNVVPEAEALFERLSMSEGEQVLLASVEGGQSVWRELFGASGEGPPVLEKPRQP